MSPKLQPADIVATLMQTLGIGTLAPYTDSWAIYINDYVDQPVNQLSVSDTSGPKFGRNQETGAAFRHYGIQIRVCGESQPIAYAKALEIESKLETVINATVTTESLNFRVQSFTQQSQIIPLGSAQGNNDREVYTINYTVPITQL